MTLKVISTSDRLTIESDSPAETERLAGKLGALLGPGAAVALYGDLGAGKTVFARGLIHGLGVAKDMPVTSPTFVIISEYEGRMPIHHVDAYRLAGAGDIVDLGSRELFFSGAVSIVEWADRVAAALPDDRLDVALEVAGESARRIEIAARGAEAASAASSLAAELAGP